MFANQKSIVFEGALIVEGGIGARVIAIRKSRDLTSFLLRLLIVSYSYSFFVCIGVERMLPFQLMSKLL